MMNSVWTRNSEVIQEAQNVFGAGAFSPLKCITKVLKNFYLVARVHEPSDDDLERDVPSEQQFLYISVIETNNINVRLQHCGIPR